MHRRTLLRDAAGLAAVCLLPACRRPAVPTAASEVSSASQPPLVVADAFLHLHGDVVTRAWAKTSRVPLRLDPGDFGPGDPLTTADLATVGAVGGTAYVTTTKASDASVVVLDPYLKQRNFSPTTLLPTAFGPLQDADGKVLGLPLYVGECQLYVNEALVPGGGGMTWTFEKMASVLADVVAKHGLGPAGAIVGFGWTEAPNFFPALVQGWGGDLFTSSGRIDVPSLQPALDFLIPLAKRYGWRPAIVSAPGDIDRSYAFSRDGFTGPGAQAVFAFDQPWVRPVPPDGFGKGLTEQHQIGNPAFPTLPVRPLVPASSVSGLAVSKQSRQPDQAVAFLLWLLEAPQQQMLIGLGVPPVVQSPALLAAWDTAQAQMGLPRFDPQHYLDVSARLARAPVAHPSPAQGPGAQGYVQQAIKQMYQTGDVAAGLSQLETVL